MNTRRFGLGLLLITVAAGCGGDDGDESPVGGAGGRAGSTGTRFGGASGGGDTPGPSRSGAFKKLSPPSDVIVDRTEASSGYDDGRLVLWGGRGLAIASSYWDDGVLWDVKTGAWTKLPAAPGQGRKLPAIALTGPRLFLWGGEEQKLSADERFTGGAVLDLPTMQWTELPTGGPSARRDPIAVAVGNFVLVSGGSDFVGVPNSAVFDLGTRTWTPVTHPPDCRDDDVEVVALPGAGVFMDCGLDSHVGRVDGSGAVTWSTVDLEASFKDLVADGLHVAAVDLLKTIDVDSVDLATLRVRHASTPRAAAFVGLDIASIAAAGSTVIYSASLGRGYWLTPAGQWREDIGTFPGPVTQNLLGALAVYPAAQGALLIGHTLSQATIAYLDLTPPAGESVTSSDGGADGAGPLRDAGMDAADGRPASR